VNHDLVAVVVLLEHIPFSLNTHSPVVNDADIRRSVMLNIIHHDNIFSLVETKKIFKQTELSFL